MKKFKKSLAIFLTLAMITGLTACNNGGTDSSDTTSGEVSQNSSVNSEEPTEIVFFAVSETLDENQMAEPVSYTHLDVYKRQVVDCRKELDPMTEGMLKMMGVFAELERNMISQRVKSGMENAKAKGKTIGRPTVTADDIPANFYKHYPKYKKGEINKKEFSRLCSLSYPTIYKYLRMVEG